MNQMASGLFWKPSGSRMCPVSFSAGVVGRLASNCPSLVLKVELESCERNSWLLRVAHFKPGIPTLGHFGHWCCLILAQRCNPAIDHLSFFYRQTRRIAAQPSFEAAELVARDAQWFPHEACARWIGHD